jgi:hypothetical protein
MLNLRFGFASALAALVLLSVPQRAAGQTGSCLPLDDEATGMLNWATHLATGTDSSTIASRQGLQVPAVAANRVKLVTKASTCKKASDAYSAALNEPSNPGRAVYVVQIGSVYLVEDPTQLIREWTQGMVFDRKFVLLERYAG